MRGRFLRLCALFAACLGVGVASAQLGGPPPPDPLAVLAQAKAASGGAAWDALRTQHTKVSLQTGGLAGEAERWSEFTTGRSSIVYTLGPITGAAGFDGKVAWSQEASGPAQAEASDAARELAVNAAYRDRLAFWYPERAAARIAYKERAEADGAFFDVVRITPEGGRPFELWVNTETKLIERLVEREAQATRTEIYMDLREVAGVQIPFRVRASRGDRRHDEVVVVEVMEFNTPVSDARFAQPPPPQPDFVFPAGRAAVEVPFEFVNGHVFVRVSINGKPAVRMLLDSRGRNVLLPSYAEQPAPGVGIARADRIDIGGVTLERQVFATLDLEAFLRRVEGMDDIAGVLGYEIFRRLPLRIDYDRSRVTLYDPAKFGYSGSGSKLPLVFRGNAAQVRASVDGIAGIFNVDTGNRGSLSLARAFAQTGDFARTYKPTGEMVLGATLAGPMRGTLVRVKTLALGDLVVADPVTALGVEDAAGDADVAGTIGNGILRRFAVTFDFPGNALYLEKGAAFAQRETHDRAGLWIERGRNGFEVVDVLAGGPADAAGLKPGDVIVAIDGKPWTSVALGTLRASLRADPGRAVRLKLEGGATRTLVLRNLV